jgi:hypothetical protein
VRWDRNYESSDVEDRRAESGPDSPGGFGGGGGLDLLWLFSRFGWRGTLLGLLVIGGAAVVRAIPHQHAAITSPAGGAGSAGEDELVHFVGFVFDDVQRTWTAKLANYHDAKLVLYRGSYPSACGRAETATGPFYCPNDQKVYLDLAFYDELRKRFGSPGDFAQAYVIAHELGHHVQNLSGLLGHGRPSVEIELQADCLAGAWAKDADARGEIEAGDVQEALHAAAAIGDDAIQRQEQGYVRPDTFTHGSSAQRTAAFQRGLDGGAPACLGAERTQ